MKKVLLTSIITIAVSTLLYIYKIPYWYYTGVFGVWLLFAYLSSLKGNKTTLNLNKKQFIYLYISLSIFGILIELIGRAVLNWWHYPRTSPIITNIAIVFLYPIILISFIEMYNFIISSIKKPLVATLLSVVAGIIIWEVPNIYSKDWIYTLPYNSLEILNINVIIILGWFILILGPRYIANMLNLKEIIKIKR